jgi:hypothetical protein
LAVIASGTSTTFSPGSPRPRPVELVRVDEELLASIGCGTPPQLRTGSAPHQALTAERQRPDVDHLVALAA